MVWRGFSVRNLAAFLSVTPSSRNDFATVIHYDDAITLLWTSRNRARSLAVLLYGERCAGNFTDISLSFW